MNTVILDGKTLRLFKFQEDLAQTIVENINKGSGFVVDIQAGMGKRVIMQRVADLLNPRQRESFGMSVGTGKTYSIEKRVGDTVTAKLQELGRVVRTKDSWSDLLTDKTMKPKKLTKLQKIKQKLHQQGYELGVKSRNETCKYWEEKYHDSIKKMEELKREYEELEHRVKSFRDTMQAINTISQGTSRL